MDGWPSCWHCYIVWYVTRPSCAALHIYTNGTQLSKKAGVCAVMSVWLVHIKDHLWTIRFVPNHRASNSSNLRLRLVMMANGLTSWMCHVRQHHCMLPGELRWEEVAPPQKPDRHSRLARTSTQCPMESTFHNAWHSIKEYTKLPITITITICGAWPVPCLFYFSWLAEIPLTDKNGPETKLLCQKGISWT